MGELPGAADNTTGVRLLSVIGAEMPILPADPTKIRKRDGMGGVESAKPNPGGSYFEGLSLDLSKLGCPKALQSSSPALMNS
jgi:hypothetical protein